MIIVWKKEMDLIIMVISNQRDVCIHTIDMIRVSKILTYRSLSRIYTSKMHRRGKALIERSQHEYIRKPKP